MKKYLLTSMFFIGVILVILGSDLFTQNKDNKIKYFNESISLEKDKKYEASLKKIQDIYDLNKNDYLVNIRLAWLLYLNGKYQESKKIYETAIKISDEGSIEAYLGLTYPLSSLNEWDNIKEIYKKVLKIEPNNYTANLRLGQIYLSGKKYSDAKEHLEKVHKLYPSDYESNVSLSWLYFYIKKYSDAKELFMNTLMISPNDSLANYGLNLVK